MARLESEVFSMFRSTVVWKVSLKWSARAGGMKCTSIFELDGGEYFYFQYKRNQLQFYTNNKEIMTAFREIDPKKRSLSAKDGMPAYKYNPSTKGKVNLFLSKFE